MSDERPDDRLLAALLARAAAGDTAAFMTFYDRTVAVAHRYACAAASPERADALVRSTYLRAWASAGEHARSGLSPLAWLLCVARSADAHVERAS